MDIMGDDGHDITPGPGVSTSIRAPPTRKRPWVTLRSGTICRRAPSNRRAATSSRTTGRIWPGPGAYQVNDAATINHLPGANPNNNPYPLRVGRGFASGDVDRQAMNATAPITGTGSYDSHLSQSINHEARKKFERMSRTAKTDEPGHGSLGFNGRAPQRELPHEKHKKEHSKDLAPGTYNPGAIDEVGNQSKRTYNVKMKAGTGQFGVTTPLGGIAKDGRNLTPADTGDPGAYEPSSDADLGKSKSFQSSNKSGNGAFGSTPNSMSKRELKMDIMGDDGHDITPGPGVYDVDKGGPWVTLRSGTICRRAPSNRPAATSSRTTGRISRVRARIRSMMRRRSIICRARTRTTTRIRCASIGSATQWAMSTDKL